MLGSAAAGRATKLTSLGPTSPDARAATPSSALRLALVGATVRAFTSASLMRTAPAADRNKEPIAQALARFPPFSAPSTRARCLEIASGTGQHVAHLAARFDHVAFQPTEFAGGSATMDAEPSVDLVPVFASIKAWAGSLANVAEPQPLDASAASWPSVEVGEPYDAIYAANICHISPFAATEGLLAGAGRLLCPGGRAFIYGPFKVDGAHTAPSNEAFDRNLRAQDASWGVRDAGRLAELGAAHGLSLEERVSMPANNFILVFKKA